MNDEIFTRFVQLYGPYVTLARAFARCSLLVKVIVPVVAVRHGGGWPQPVPSERGDREANGVFFCDPININSPFDYNLL